jgi:hypothetical protein
MELITLLLISLISAILSGIFNAFTDTCECKPYYDKSVFSKYPTNVFYKGESWVWKWFDGYPNVERFFGSSKWFVSLTDFWHWSELNEIVYLLIAMGSCTLALFPIFGYWSIPASLAGVYIVSSTVFDYFFHRGLKKSAIIEAVFIRPFWWMHKKVIQ